MKKFGILFLLLFCLVLSGCAGKNGNGKPTESSESESFVIGLDPSESETEEEEVKAFQKNSVWEAYGTPLDLAIQMDEGTMQFDSIYHDLFSVLITYHFIPKKQNWEPGSKVNADMAKMLRELAEFALKRGENSPPALRNNVRKNTYFEPKVREDGSVGGLVLLEFDMYDPPIMENASILCFRKTASDGQILPDETYELPLASDFDHRNISLDEVKLDPNIEVEGAVLSSLGFVIYGRIPYRSVLSEKDCNAEINKIAKSYQILLNNDEVFDFLGQPTSGKLVNDPDEKGYFKIYTQFDKPLELKNVKSIVLESGEVLLPEEE